MATFHFYRGDTPPVPLGTLCSSHSDAVQTFRTDTNRDLNAASGDLRFRTQNTEIDEGQDVH